MPVPEEPKEPVPEEPNDGQTSQKSYVEDAPSDAIDAGSLSMAVADLWEASDFGHLYESEGLSLLGFTWIGRRTHSTLRCVSLFMVFACFFVPHCKNVMWIREGSNHPVFN